MRTRYENPIEVVVEPGRVWQRDELKPLTIALDGAVEGPWIDAESQRYSFDHHQGCIRMVTSATCQQVLDAIVLGLDPGGFRVLVNDVDGDTVLSVWLLQNWERWLRPADLARVRPLVASVAAVDAHGPAMPAPDGEMVRHYYSRIIGAPRVREAGMKAEDGLHDMNACLGRLEDWWRAEFAPMPCASSGVSVPSVTSFGSWVLCDATHAHPDDRGAGVAWIYEQGWHRWILFRRLPGGRWHYSIGKRSDLVAGFPVPEILGALSDAEAVARGRDLAGGERWGGGTTIGGSPRDGGSLLHPDAVAGVVELVVRREAVRRSRNSD